MALVFAPAANAVLSSVAPHEAGKASGATNAIREVGGVLGVAVLASVFSGPGATARRSPSSTASCRPCGSAGSSCSPGRWSLRWCRAGERRCRAAGGAGQTAEPVSAAA